MYGQSLKDITGKIESLEFSIGKLKQKYDWMDADDPERAKIKSQIQSKIYQKQYQEQLQSQVEGILKQMQTKSFATVSEYLDECYTDGFIGTIFDAHGQNVPFMAPINQESMVRAVQLDSKISKGLYTRLGEDVDMLKKKITAQVSRSVATGMTFAETAKQLENYTRIGYNNAIRIARTEGHRIQTTATMDAMTAAKDNGADVVKQWDSTLDGRTRSSHVAVDGEIRELNKKFSNGLAFPGDPSGKAGEVVNCRCALLQRARWALDDGAFTKFNGFTGQIETFDSPEDYAEFKKAYMSKENRQYMDYVEQMQGKYGTKDFAKVLDSMSESEYKHYSKLLENNPIYYNKDKIDVTKGVTAVGADSIQATNGGKAQTTKKTTSFVPAKTLDEAEEYIRRYVDDSQFGALGVSYAGISVESANAVNEALTDLYETFGLEKLGGVFVAKGNSKLGKKIEGATAAYSPIRKTLLLNNRSLKNLNQIVETHAEELRLIQQYAKDPTSLVFSTKKVEGIVKASLVSGRATVPGTIQSVIHHEMGHFIEPIVKKSGGYEVVKVNMPKFAEKISGYSTLSESEYIAESFASYLMGENLADPELIKIFEGLKR